MHDAVAVTTVNSASSQGLKACTGPKLCKGCREGTDKSKHRLLRASPLCRFLAVRAQPHAWNNVTSRSPVRNHQRPGICRRMTNEDVVLTKLQVERIVLSATHGKSSLEPQADTSVQDIRPRLWSRGSSGSSTDAGAEQSSINTLPDAFRYTNYATFVPTVMPTLYACEACSFRFYLSMTGSPLPTYVPTYLPIYQSNLSIYMSLCLST